MENPLDLEYFSHHQYNIKTIIILSTYSRLVVFIFIFITVFHFFLLTINYCLKSFQFNQKHFYIRDKLLSLCLFGINSSLVKISLAGIIRRLYYNLFFPFDICGFLISSDQEILGPHQ